MSETSAHHLSRAVDTLDGVGPARAKRMKEQGIATLGDLLEYFPRNYQYERSECPIDQLKPEVIQIARGEVIAVDYISGGRPRFEATIQDPTGRLALVWFNGAYLRRLIRPGQFLRVKGKVRFFRGLPQMQHPKHEVIEPDAPTDGQDLIRAVYPASEYLPSLTLWNIIDKHFRELTGGIAEYFDPDMLSQRRLMGRQQAYQCIHKPQSFGEARDARRRLVYDELMLMQIGLALSKKLRGGRLTAPALRVDKLLDQRIRKRFPFNLTGAQERAVHDILRDVQTPAPMSRLLQGDVGSGKTIVALYAMLVAVANRMQAAILAPTEVLAEQHFLTLSNLLKESQVRIELFTNRTKRQSRGAISQDLAEGQVHIAVGTQALLMGDVEFANLGLVVVDEQHKLGVRQRASLKGKGFAPHYLVMTATPIPRTLALSYFADFDVSVIDELPPGRQPIKTQWLRQAQADQAYAFVVKQVKQGRQAYIVMPQIDDDGSSESKAVTTEFERLKEGPLRGLRLAMLHGQMNTEEKQQVMGEFRGGRVDVLVATTVIEVGVDVPNATVMVIENADRFGLSQLHQIRGRVGRGVHESHCLLIGEATTDEAKMRLNAMCATNDGFEIAETDLKLRGPGDFFGTRQHGLPPFKLADITQELDLLHETREDALALLNRDPMLEEPRHRGLREAITRQFGDGLFLAQVG